MPRRYAATLLAALALLAGNALPAHAAAGTNLPPAPATMTVTWSDGHTGTTRTFNSSDYQHNPDALPTLRVHVPPASGKLVWLQFHQNGEWADEWITRVSAHGNAKLPIDPTCLDGTWCDGTYQYRLKTGRTITHLTLEYRDR
jgi:hypothetical protein